MDLEEKDDPNGTTQDIGGTLGLESAARVPVHPARGERQAAEKPQGPRGLNEAGSSTGPSVKGTSSGPGQNEAQRKESITAQNVRDRAAAIEESLKSQKEERDPFKTPQGKTKKGRKRPPIKEVDDSSRANQPQESPKPQ